MSNKQREALEAAREFNRYFTSMNGVDVDARISVPRDEWRALRDKIEAVLAEPVQEPVAWLVGAKQWVYFDKTRAEDEAKFIGELAQPLYTSPQSREWQE